jgi:hypothetical protein
MIDGKNVAKKKKPETRKRPPTRTSGAQKGTGPKPRPVSIARRKEVDACLALCMRHSDIVVHIKKKFQISERQVHYDINQAYRRHEEDEDDARPKRKNNMRRTMEALYRKCLIENDLKAGIQVLDRLCKLDGLYAPEKIEFDKLPQLKTADRRARLAELLAIASARTTGKIIEATVIAKN